MRFRRAAGFWSREVRMVLVRGDIGVIFDLGFLIWKGTGVTLITRIFTNFEARDELGKNSAGPKF